MGVAQSDWQFHAYNGSSDYEGDAFTDLRAVFAVHPEPFTVVARADSGVETFTDLAGKRVNVGNPGSGSRGTFEVVLEAMGMSMDDFALSSELRPAEQSAALGDNQVDAISYTVGHPNGSIQKRPRPWTRPWSTCPASDRQADRGQSVLLQGRDPRRHVCRQRRRHRDLRRQGDLRDPRPRSRTRRCTRSSRRSSTTSIASRACTRPSPRSTPRDDRRRQQRAPAPRCRALLSRTGLDPVIQA